MVVSGLIPVAATEMNKVVSLLKADTSGRCRSGLPAPTMNFVAVTGNNPAQTSGIAMVG